MAVENKHKTLIYTIPIALVLLGLTVYHFGYEKVKSEYTSVTEEQEIKGKTLEKYIALLGEKPDLENHLAKLKALRKREGLKLIGGKTLSLAAAELLNIVKRTITSKDGRITSERVGKPTELESFTIIRVSVDTVLPDPGVLKDILYSLETSTPSLVVKALDARIANYRNPRELIVKMEVSALTE